MIYTDATIVLDAVDISGDSNEVMVEFTRADLDRTTFRNGGGKRRVVGLPDMTGTVAGFWTAEIDEQVDDLGGASADLVIAPSAEVGSPCFVTSAKLLSFNRGGKIDELIPFSFNYASARRAGAARGTILFAPTVLVTAPVAAAGLELGALDVGETATVRVQVLSVESAGTVDIDIESSATNGWSSPDVEATADGLAAGDIVSFTVTGPVTNTWWRARITDADDDAVLIVTVDDF